MTTQEQPLPTEHELARRIANTLAKLSPGDLAELRRYDAAKLQSPAFWRVVAMHLDAHLSGDDHVRVEQERRWAVVMAAMAEAKGLHNPGVRLGKALAEAVDERRVLQVLRAHDEALADAVRMVVHHLVSKGLAFDHAQLAWLVLSDGRADEQRARRAVYQDFFAAMPRD